ncbi:MAG: transporter fusion protein [Hyphomicrobiales bacterium]|nr:transporter fusion protein [Hyphomicrobiales bacterium]
MPVRRLGPFVTLAQALLIGIIIAWVANLPTRLSISLYTEQFLAASLGLALFLTFISFPGWTRKAGEVHLVDVATALAGFAACAYVAIFYPTLVNELVYRPWDGVLVGATIVLLILEATRRTAGLALVIVIGVLCLYAYFGNLLPGVFGTRPVQLSRLAVYLGIDTNAVFGTSLQVALITVAPFLLMGQILTLSGGGDFFTDISTALMGRFRGGSAKIAVFGSALFGMISGSAVANVAGVGMITIPLMKRAGFPPQVAASIEAVGSTGGQLMPPVMGAAAFLIAEYLQVSYASVVWAALLPAVLYYVALFIQVDLEAAKLGISGSRREDLPRAWIVLREGWQFPIPFLLLIGGLLWLNMAAEYAALLATVVLLAFAMTVGYRGKRLTTVDALRAIVATGASVIDLIIITAAAGLVIGVLNMTGLAFGLTDQLLALAGDNVFVLLLISAFVAIILGMGMPTVGVYVIMATLAAPALIRFGLEPMQAHLFLMYFGMMSMVTPPVALAAFAAANIAQTDPWKTGWTAVRVGWSAYLIPFLFALSPALLLKGAPGIVILSASTAILGVMMGSVAMVGFLFAPIAAWLRVVYMAVGLALLVPADAFHGAMPLNLGAIVAALALIFFDWTRAKTRRSAPQTV